ncbi:uncharacterized protein FIBRA_07754 [Fibroporia radiculosa]|uniref:Uncharacterized protein n=1 Tax=Fibroporia radiculosa TaxID=599839 RepID=J4GFG4_9APHY|nr:uncharacterized protein FIBRA_07754 [Fibroporia radiculosa]CCM05528.1 predicted protein [Fibroporia radiculosa]
MSACKHQYLIPNVQHSSLDPPGVRPQLTFQFKPTWLPLTRKDASAASEYEPYVTLPRILIPILGHPLRPPRMRYGWIANEDVLVELAKEFDCIVMYNDCPYFLDDGDDEDLDEEERNVTVTRVYDTSSPEQAILTARYNPDKFPHESEGRYAARLAGWDVLRTMQRVVELVGEEVPATQDRLALPGALFHNRAPSMVSVFTNYDLTSDRLPDADDLDKLARRLGVQGKPRWFLDSIHWRWHDNGQPY